MLHHQVLIHLKQEEFFKSFPTSVRAQLINKSETRILAPGEAAFSRGEEGDWMGSILSGRIKICIRTGDGKELLLNMYERGEIFGDRSLLDGQPRGADAIAETEATFLVIRRDVLVPLLFQYPEAMFMIVQMLCNRMLRYTETMELYALQNLTIRLASFILFMAGQYGKDINGRCVIDSGFSQADIGHKLGSSRESINRQLKVFADKGFIGLHGDEIILLNRAGLERVCETGALD